MKRLLKGSIRKTLVSTVAISCMITAFCIAPSQKAAAEPVVLKMATFEPPQSFNTKEHFKPLVDQINRDGKGIVKIDLFAGGVLGRSPLQQLKLLKDGVSDIALIVNAYHPGQLVDDQIVNTPFMAKSSKQCTAALVGMRNKGLLRGYEDLVVISQICLGQYIIHSKFPIRVPSDLKGIKLRTAGKMHHSLAKAVDGVPIGMPITKTAEALSRGVVGAVFIDFASSNTFRISDVATYHIEIPLGTNSIMIAMTKEKYQSLPAGVRAVLDKNKGLQTSLDWATITDKYVGLARNKAKQNSKHTIFVPDASETMQWQKAFQPVVTSWGKVNNRWDSLLKGYKEGLTQ